MLEKLECSRNATRDDQQREEGQPTKQQDQRSRSVSCEEREPESNVGAAKKASYIVCTILVRTHSSTTSKARQKAKSNSKTPDFC